MLETTAFKTAVSRLRQRIKLPPWVALMLLSAVLFLAGSTSFMLHGAHHLAQVGIVGAIAAVAVLAAFSR